MKSNPKSTQGVCKQCRQRSVADPGFSPGGAPTSQVGVRTYFFGRKLHENERILAPQGGARPWRPPLDPPLKVSWSPDR